MLSRAVWSPLQLSRVLLLLLIRHLAKEDEPLVFGIDETLERRWGSCISAKGIFRDAVRSTGTHMVRASGPALGQLDVADSHSLGQPHMGASRTHRSGAIGELPPKDGTTA